jgi:phage/plasmid-like protein (TIGR03299 family)
MTEQTTTSAYQHADPWHRLGKDLSTATSVAEALQLAGLDWTVSLHDTYWYNERSHMGLTGVESENTDDKYVHVPQRKVVVRNSDQKILGTVGNAYVPLQNAEAFSVLDLAIREFGVKLIAGGTHGTQRAWILARLPEEAEVVDGDTVCPYFLVSTGHDGATPYVAVPTPFRIACANSLDIAIGQGFRDMTVRLTHTKDAATKLTQVSDMLTSVLTSFQQVTARFKKLARSGPLFQPEINAYIDDVLGIEDGDEVKGVMERRRDRIRELVTTGKGAELAPRSAWAVYNAVTEYVDHVLPAEVTAKRQVTANEAALFGRNALLKNRALTLTKGLVS